MYCSSCGRVIKREAALCVGCGVPTRRGSTTGAYRSGSGTGEGKNKVVAILLAVFFGQWTWVYTYREDGTKFWIAMAVNLACLVLTIFTLGLFLFFWIPILLGLWLWPLIETITRKDEWFEGY
jgi:hypothetical protein